MLRKVDCLKPKTSVQYHDLRGCPGEFGSVRVSEHFVFGFENGRKRLKAAGRIHDLKRPVIFPDCYSRGIGRPRKLRTTALALDVDLSDFSGLRNGHDGQDSIIINESQGLAVARDGRAGEGAWNLSTNACGNLDRVNA